MERQDTNFLGGDGFGIESSSSISPEMADLILGGGATTADPTTVQPIVQEETEEEKNKKKKEEVTPQVFTENDILGKEEEVENSIEENNVEDSKPDSNSIFSSLTKNLESLGIFNTSDDNEEIKTDEQFRDRWIKEKQIQVQQDIYSFLSEKHGEEGIEAFEAIFVKGMNPRDFYTQSTQIEDIKNLDITKESVQEQVYKEYYRRQGLSEEKIDKKLQRAKDYGDLEEESKDFQDLLIQQDTQILQQKVQEAQKQEELRQKQRIEYSNNLNSILGEKLKQREFDGIPVTEKTARETYSYLFDEKWVLPTGEKITDFDKDILELRNPKNHSQKIKLALLLKNGLDLSKIKNSLVSKETNKLFGDLVTKEKNAKRNNSLNTSKSFLDNI